MTSRPEITKSPDIFNALEAAIYLGLEGTYKDQLVEKLCRKGHIRAKKPSNKQGWKIHRKACDDYLLMEVRR